jgi:photosystem II stability/assembly factor-like uncharacterized protein
MHRTLSALTLALLSAAMLAQTPSLPALKSVPPSIPYVYKNVVIRAGGFVSGLVFSTTQPNLVYARTDVGGAYRSDDGGNLWIPITDQFGPRDTTYTGIESIALDPSDSNKLYLAAGMYTSHWGGPSAIFRSSDKGRTYLKSPMPFKMGGNDDGRGVGERLAVDPNLGSTLYFGSRLAGLWRSSDSGATWSHVDSFPAPAHLTGPGEKTGITFVLFDPSSSTRNSPTKTIYAGVAQAGASLYRSTDAGLTWQLIPGTPKDLFPTHAVLVPGKTLYLTFDDNPGPNGITTGQVLRHTIADSTFKNISPISPGTASAPGNHNFGFGGISLDLEHPDTLMVTTQDRWYPKDAIFRSTNGGNSWTNIGGDAVYSAPTVPWVYWHKGQIGGTGWMQSIAIDPFHSQKVMYTTGEGIYGSADITNADSDHATHWGFPDVGLEELVVSDVISPPSGAPLLSTVWDLDGFRHEDLTHSPSGGIFTNPQLTTGRSIDFAANDPNLLARVGWSDKAPIRGAYSKDNGVTWKPFASEPPSSHRGGGLIALSADGNTIVWSPDDGAPYLTTNWGSTWTQCIGLTEKMRVVSDRVNPLNFYSLNPDTGELLISTDAAHTFTAHSTPIAHPVRDIEIAPTPGLAGDLWISAGNKLLHTSDSGTTFSTLEGLSAVHRLGFGKAAPGKSTPAIYLTGIVQETEGLFRSTDAGQTWLRIDDPSHQFGSKESITGDPRIFGRVYFGTGGRGILYGDPVAP